MARTRTGNPWPYASRRRRARHPAGVALTAAALLTVSGIPTALAAPPPDTPAQQSPGTAVTPAPEASAPAGPAASPSGTPPPGTPTPAATPSGIPSKAPAPTPSPSGAGEQAAEAGGNAGAAAGERWVRPLAATGVRVSQPYGVRGNWAAGYHTGIDLAVPEGTPVRSVGPGTVVSAGWAGAYGNAVTVRMTDGMYTLFAHLSEIFVTPGTAVRPGTWLGLSGNTGRSTGPHLHFEVRAQRGYGTDVDPVHYLAEHGVLLV
ncbi:M23 family metallopeptidase [Streptomyces sp. CA-250714]|uniref:M23 family metallopeptidase n=1 Tax=Streptomyces sp. CA-250714 TaxID=3240060 RepID=UPI003D8D4D99